MDVRGGGGCQCERDGGGAIPSSHGGGGGGGKWVGGCEGGGVCFGVAAAVQQSFCRMVVVVVEVSGSKVCGRGSGGEGCV